MMDDATWGGYLSKHNCPPAFDGSDGNPYSVQVYVDEAPLEEDRFGAAILFVRWSVEGGGVVGHLETEYLGYGSTPDEAGACLMQMTLYDLKDHLERLIHARKEVPGW